MAENIRACDDLIACATGIRDRKTRKALLGAALRHLEAGDSSMSAIPGRDERPSILDIETALIHNSWALNPTAGDLTLPWPEWLAVKKRRLVDAVESRERAQADILWFGSIEQAVRDIQNRHGTAAVLPFMSKCWESGLIFSIDDFFLSAFNVFRCDAFGLEWEDCSAEMSAAQAEVERGGEALTLLTRARALARRDAELGRVTGPLASLAQKEHAAADTKRAYNRQQPFCEFLRGLFTLKPIYYTLRDIYFELHFLATDPEEKAFYEHQETLVDEFQADIGQMMMMPGSILALEDTWKWAGKSHSANRRQVSYWLESRAQINDEIAAMLLTRLGSSNANSAAAEAEIKTWVFESLSPGFIEARSLLERAFAPPEHGS